FASTSPRFCISSPLRDGLRHHHPGFAIDGARGCSQPALIFEDERCLVYPDRLDCETEEQRWHAVGAAQIERQTRAVPLVVHAYREDYHGEEIIRIISARAAEKHEIRKY